MMNRKANGKYRHPSNTMTVRSAVGTGMCHPSKSQVPVVWERNAIGLLQPSTCWPNSLIMPNCGLSMMRHTKVTATIGATYGSKSAARTSVRPRNGLRSAIAARRPRKVESTTAPTV